MSAHLGRGGLKFASRSFGSTKLERGLTEEELEVAEACVKFAMENCPVEGLLSKEDGTPLSLDELQTMQEKLEEIENSADLRLGEDLTSNLRSVIGYTSENCPVEQAATYHDGRPISGRDITSLDEKLKSRGQSQTGKGGQAATL